MDSFFRLHYAEETDSTNEWIKRLEAEGAPEGTVAVADMQTAGKGRGGRRWESPKGDSISFSVLVRPSVAEEKAPMLSILMGLALRSGIAAATGTEPMIKWPNDVILSGKKLCGILTELIPKEEGYAAVTGAGINNGIRIFPEELRDKATSLVLETGKTADREQLLACILQDFHALYRSFEDRGDLSGMTESYNRYLVNRGRKVRILEKDGAYTATASGIDETGALHVTKEDGTPVCIRSGEVSVRGLYGYV